jgi:hypothetical protein
MWRSLPARSTKPWTRDFVVVVGEIVLDLFDRARQVGDQIVVDLLAGVDAAGRGAVLARVVEAERLEAGDDLTEISVVEDDDRRLAAELKMRALEGG